jgi:hypothetical protein
MQQLFRVRKSIMLIFILIPLAFAYARGYRILPLFRVFDLYPFFFVCLCHGFFVMNAWIGNYDFVRFASIIQYFMIFSLFLISQTAYLCPSLRLTSTLSSSVILIFSP